MRDIKDFFSMIGAICRGRYPFPWKTFLLALLCVVYIISPVDFLPDVMPLLGITDDATFLLLVLAMIRQDIRKYRSGLTSPGAKGPNKEDIIDVGDFKDHKK